MSDAAWCIADPHFGQDDPALAVFYACLDAFGRQGVRHLVLLGDLFHVWVGLPAVQTPEQREVLRRLRALASTGRSIIYLRGNRDYFIEEPLAEAGVLLRDEWTLRLPCGLLHFEHGDLINSSDLAYLRWREISRSSTVRALYRILSPAKQFGIAQRLERGLGGTNAYYKSYRPERELARWADLLAAQGVHTAILGHFHVEDETSLNGVDIRFLPQFREDGAFLRIGEDGACIMDHTAP